jgi:uncharacterized protein YndB with AHSA1/START domain
MNTPGNAAYEIDSDLITMRFERLIPQPIERVWAALTEPEELSAWLYPFEGTLAVGQTVLIPWEEDGGLTSTIMEYAPPHLLAWTWQKPGDPESIVRWELVSESGGTRFVLTHSLPILAANEPSDTLAGWHEHLDTLVDYLAGRRRTWSSERWRQLKDQYAVATELERVPGDDGIVETINGQRQLHFARLLDAPLERVWRALTTSKEVSAWFTKAEVDLREGGTYTLDFSQYGHEGIYPYRILTLEPPRVVEFQFGEHEDDVVRWELFADGERTLLVLTNRLNGSADAAGQLGGWHYHLDRLPGYLAGEPDSRPADHAASITAHYREIGAAV